MKTPQPSAEAIMLEKGVEGKYPNSLSGSATKYRTKGWKFTARSVDNGVRIWRIA